ncbi:MAG: TIGR02677 family protein [Planctomycetaceae bacterium]
MSPVSQAVISTDPVSRDGGVTAEGSFAALSYLTAEKCSLYHAIVEVFADAKAGFLLHLRPAEVASRLSQLNIAADGGTEGVEAALTQLCHWGVLEAYNDNADVATLADFHRRRLQYQLTAAGEAAQEAAQHFLSRLNRRITLDAAALGRIHDHLSQLSVLVATTPIDGEKAFGTLRQIVADVEDLTTRAQSFFRWLHEQTESRRSDLDAFLEYKERLIEYLTEFVGELVTRGARIADVLNTLAPASDALLDAVTLVETRGSYDAADPTGRAMRTETLSLWRKRWQGLRRWFLDDAATPAQSRQLQIAARAAIPRVLALAQQQRLRQGNKSDRAADFRELATWFAEAEDDRSAHRLWRAAFGLSAARHLTVDVGRLQEEDADPTSADTPWADARPVVIDPQLRKSGRQRTASATRGIIDTSDARRELKRRLQRERQQEAETRQYLVALGRRRFSEADFLPAAAFALLMELIGDAVDNRRDQPASFGISKDGRLKMTVDWSDDDGDSVHDFAATIATEAGQLNLRDATFEIELVEGK